MSAATSSCLSPSPVSALGVFPQKLGSSPPRCLVSRLVPAPCGWRAAPVAVSFFQWHAEWENWKYLKSQKLVFVWGQLWGAGFSQVTEKLLE